MQPKDGHCVRVGIADRREILKSNLIDSGPPYLLKDYSWLSAKNVESEFQRVLRVPSDYP